jgi:2-polyprenyl-3-methyl-5-hydroxy-6-metoxy-1,4-benzoquinol methylase
MNRVPWPTFGLMLVAVCSMVGCSRFHSLMVTLARFTRRIKWRVQRIVGLKSQAWDEQFHRGIWGGRARTPPEVLERAIRLCNGGRIVEFGCAYGQLSRDLPVGAYSSYTGIDISGFAIGEAKKRAQESCVGNCHFLQCDMATWSGDFDVSLILLEECLNYLKGETLRRFLTRCCHSLSKDGFILVIVHSAYKHRRTLDACRTICQVVKEELVETRTFLTLAQRCPGRT